MIKNAVIKVLDEFVGTDKLEFISGKIGNVGNNNCQLSEQRGSVYGIAIKINSEEEKKEILSENNEVGLDISNWKSIGDNYYPLYWGKDKSMGSRLDAHTKSPKGTGTLQLNRKTKLKNKEIIYGAILCSNSENIESQLHKSYPDILRTKSEK